MGFLSSEKLIVGYDLGNKNCQISYAVSENGSVETLSMVAGTQAFWIPAVVCKRSGVNQWLYGRDALRCAEEEQGILVEDLLELALDGEPVIIEGELFEPVALLALFFKRSLGKLAQVGAPDKIAALMITSSVMDRRMKELLTNVLATLSMKPDRVYFQSYTESFYHYMIHQPQELWMHQTILFHYNEKGICRYRLECNQRTTPIVSFVEEKEYPLWEETLSTEQADGVLLGMAMEACEGAMVSSVYLIGDGFAGEWARETLRYLCRGRRVFQGNNMFSKGACHSMLEILNPGEIGKSHVFLGRDTLKANVGMRVLRNGEDSYYAALDAGVNWYEAEHEMEFYVQDGNDLNIVITPLVGTAAKTAVLYLEELPPVLTRLRLRFYLEAENLLVVEATDLGLGEFRAPSGHVWTEKMEIYD